MKLLSQGSQHFLGTKFPDFSLMEVKKSRIIITTGQTKFPDFPLIWGTFLKFPDFFPWLEKGEVIFQVFPDFQVGWEPCKLQHGCIGIYS